MNTSAEIERELRRQRAEPTRAAQSEGPMLGLIGSGGRGPLSAGRGKEKLQAGRGRSGASLLRAARGGYVGDWGGVVEHELNEPKELNEPIRSRAGAVLALLALLALLFVDIVLL